MNTLGSQLEAILAPRLRESVERGGKAMAEAMAEKMKENTLSGTSVAPSNYDARYNESYARRRARQGLPRSPVTLRAHRRRIERTVGSTITAQGGKVEFENSHERANPKSKSSGTIGEVFYMHHTGNARGGKVRQLFPYADQHNLVPKDIVDDTVKLMTEALNGR